MAKLAIKSDNRKQNLLLPPSLDELHLSITQLKSFGAQMPSESSNFCTKKKTA